MTNQELPQPDYETAKKLIANATKQQQGVLGEICTGNGTGHHPKTIKNLLEKRLIVEIQQRAGGFPPMTITRYSYNGLGVHTAWCRWCCE